MIVLLPPSETKRTGGDGPRLDLSALNWPDLAPVRAELVDELIALAADPPACRQALGISAAQDAEIERNAALRSFSEGRHRILVATDVAARGIDVANVAHVVNYDLPVLARDYVHRC